jgi:hypothetical protein
LFGYIDFCDECGYQVEHAEIEHSGIGMIGGMPVAYTWDSIGRMRGIKYRVLVELKCTYKEEKSWALQTAAYAALAPKAEGEYLARIAVRLGKDGTYKPYLYENPRDIDVFKYCLATTWWKIKNGVSWRKNNEKDVQTGSGEYPEGPTETLGSLEEAEQAAANA